MPSIEWVNHASYVLSEGEVRILCDPWLMGSAFNDGWDLVCPTRFGTKDFESITHIWYSHEHPDHFSPPSLKLIPEPLRPKITVLFQQTRDRKLIRYCEKAGFAVCELPHAQWVALSPAVRILCGKIPFFDSWCLIEAGGKKILNLNDCVVSSTRTAREIARITGSVDLMLTQFGYASWIGNPEDKPLREEAAREKLERIRLQAETLRPRWIIPFASHVYFSHEENFYLNDSVNTIAHAHEFVRTETDASPIVLYPGQTWEVNAEPDNAEALAMYARDAARVTEPRRKSVSVPETELSRLAAGYVQRILSRNSRPLIWLLSLSPIRFFWPLRIRLTDLGSKWTFSFNRGLQPSEDAKFDISMHSDSLAYLFKFDWGMDTLFVNGRFRASPNGAKSAIRTFSDRYTQRRGPEIWPCISFGARFHCTRA